MEEQHPIAKLALELGADQVTVSVSQSVSTEFAARTSTRKDEAVNSLGVGIELLVDDKYLTLGI